LQVAQPGNTFVLQALVGQLLAQGLHAEAVARIDALPPRRQTLDLQISLLEGLKGSGKAGRAEELRVRIAAVLADAAARNDGFPYKEQARFLLLIGEEPEIAVQSAWANWEAQKDVDDLLLLVRAAVAANDSATLDSARTWLHSSGLADARIDALLRNVR
jgi:hypothetical protein